MKKNLLLIIWLIWGVFFSNISFGQYSQAWIQYTNIQNTYLYNYNSALGSSSDLIVIMSGNMSDSLFVTKLDSSGSYLWQHHYKFFPSGGDHLNSNIYQDQFNNFYASIQSSSNCLLLKFNSSGQVLNVINDTLYNYLGNSLEVLQGTDANYLYVLKRVEGGGKMYNYLFKYDFNYNIIWQKK